MMVFGVPKLFCATSQPAVALKDMSVVTTAMRINVAIEGSPAERLPADWVAAIALNTTR
jgi:hypothetical protein